jgi:TatD DNase family protein
MFIDIHTHHQLSSNAHSIRNLTFPEAERLFSSDEKGFFSVGFHPWNADEFSEKTRSELEKWATDSRLVCIGECGLDKNSNVKIENQLDVFIEQINLSEKTKKPLIIHCVGCFNELFELKKTLNPQQLWIIHGFRGKPELAKQALKAGCALSFGEYFNSQSILITPIDKLFIETDKSKLSIYEIYHKIALAKSVSPESLIAGELFFQQMNLNFH